MVPASGGMRLWTMGMLMTVKASSAETGGACSVMEATFPPDAAPPLHIHHRETELNFVVEGSMRFQCGESVYECGPGDMVFLPSGVPHSFRAGHQGARMIGVTNPGGLDELYTRAGEPAQENRLPDAPPNVQKWLTLAPEFGIEVMGPPIA
jgi:quercetin dioxygenase-like cupin family protein